MTKNEAIEIAQSQGLGYFPFPEDHESHKKDAAVFCTCGHSRRLHGMTLGKGKDRIMISKRGYGQCLVHTCNCDHFQEAQSVETSATAKAK